MKKASRVTDFVLSFGALDGFGCEETLMENVLVLAPVLRSPEPVSLKAQLCVSSQLRAVLALPLAFPQVGFSMENREKCR